MKISTVYSILAKFDVDIAECFNKPEMESLKKHWFGISCQWHTALIKCLKGEEAGEDFEVPEEVVKLF